MKSYKLLMHGAFVYSLQLLVLAQTTGTADTGNDAQPRVSARAPEAIAAPMAVNLPVQDNADAFVESSAQLAKRRDEDFVAFMLSARFPHTTSSQIANLTRTLVNAAYTQFVEEGAAHHYLLGVAPLLTIEQKQKAYSLSLFDSALAPDLNKLCGPHFSKTNLKDSKNQLRAGFCYFEALHAANGSYATAAAKMDHGQYLGRLIRDKKNVVETTSEENLASDDVVLPTAVPSDDLVAVETFFNVISDERYHALFNYSLEKIAAVNPSISPMRQAVLSASLAQTTLAQLRTDEQAEAFIDMIGAVSHFQNSGRGLGGLTVSLGEFAAAECNVAYSIDDQDLDADQSGLMLSACLFKGTLRRFGEDTAMGSAAYKALVARGQTTAELFGRPVAQDYTVSAWANVLRPCQISVPEERTETLVKALAKIVHSPLQDTLRGEATFALLAKIAEAVYPRDDKGQQDWLIVLAMESKFDGGPSSETGARGIGQLIPTYAHDFGEGCNLTQVDAVDLADDATNALLSACYLKTLVKAHDGMVMLALAAYNAGLNSEDLSHFRHLSRMSNEPANYVARFALIKESLERVLPKEKPAIMIAATVPRIPMAAVGDEQTTLTH